MSASIKTADFQTTRDGSESHDAVRLDVAKHTVRRLRLTQERTVALLALGLFAVFSLTLPGFFSADNLLALVRSVSILGILGLGLAITVIGRGIDLSMIATMAMSVAWVLKLLADGVPFGTALGLGLLFVLCIALLVGWLVAYAEIPAIFATLAMATVIYGFARVNLVDVDLVFVPASFTWLRDLGARSVLGIPMPIIAFGLVALLVHLFLRYIKWGVFLRGMGDNPAKARISGMPIRPLIVLQYGISALIAFAAGLLLASVVGTINTRLVNSGMMYDVILVAVLGGVVLSGGRGGVFHVIVGTLLIGILLNGMTILDVSYAVQNVVKGAMLLAAIGVDTILNPRDEQTSQQGDI